MIGIFGWLYRRLVSHYLLYRLATALPEGGVHCPDGVGVKRMTRAMDVAAEVSTANHSKGPMMRGLRCRTLSGGNSCRRCSIQTSAALAPGVSQQAVKHPAGIRIAGVISARVTPISKIPIGGASFAD